MRDVNIQDVKLLNLATSAQEALNGLGCAIEALREEEDAELISQLAMQADMLEAAVARATTD